MTNDSDELTTYPHIYLVYILNLIMCLYLFNEYLFSMFTSIMSSFPNGFNGRDVMFFEFVEDLNNNAWGSSSVGENSDDSNGMLPHNYLNLFLTLTCCFNLISRNYSTISNSKETCVLLTPEVGALCSRQWENFNVHSPWREEVYFATLCLVQPDDWCVCKEDISSPLP